MTQPSQTLIFQEDGILMVQWGTSFDESNVPQIFSRIVEYALEAPQIIIFDFTNVENIKTVFVNAILKVHEYIRSSGGDVLLVPDKEKDVLDVTGVTKSMRVFDSVKEAKIFAKENFPQIIDFIRKKQVQQTQENTHTSSFDTKDWQFFTDETKQKIHLENLLECSVQMHASDIHMNVGKKIAYRVDGNIILIDHEPTLTHDHLDIFATEILARIANGKQILDTKHDIDFWYISKTWVSYRVNGYWARGNAAFTLRRIEQKAKNMRSLGLPDATEVFLQSKQGLVLVTGPTGSGKSTTLVAMLENINQNRAEKIVTIEDPIEFLFTDQNSLFAQREIWLDTSSFSIAIRAAMREDPDIIMIWEMRDAETVEAALNLAETGHLVFSTLHTSWSVQTISRILQFFPGETQRQICTRLADSLLGVLSQRLLPRRDKVGGRVALFELMIVNSGIKNLIRNADLWQINNAIETGRGEGMIPMYIHAESLEKQWLIRREDYIGFFTNQDI